MVTALVLGLAFQPVQAHYNSPTNTPTSTTGYGQLQISDIQCYNNQVGIQFILNNVPYGWTPDSTITFTLSVNGGSPTTQTATFTSHTGSAYHYFYYGNVNGTYDVTSAYTFVRWYSFSHEVDLHNPDAYSTTNQDCSVSPTSTTVPPTATFTSVPPTATSTAVPPTPTNTEVPPTPTNTVVPPTPTDTSVPPTATFTSVPPTATNTVVPPTPTNTIVPPTPTNTSVPPTPTDTSVPPTPTNTGVPPTATFTDVPPTPTGTSVPPTATNTPVPGTATPTLEGTTETPVSTQTTPHAPGLSPLVFIDPYCTVTMVVHYNGQWRIPTVAISRCCTGL